MLLLVCVLLPLATGAAVPLLKKTPRIRVAWLLSGACLAAALSLYLCFSPGERALRSYILPETIDFSLLLDRKGRAFLALCAILWPPAVLFSLEAMREDPRQGRFLAWYAAAFGALALVGCAGNLLTLMLGLILLAVIALALVGHTRDRDARRAEKALTIALGVGGLPALTALVGLALQGCGDFAAGGRPLAQAGLWGRALCLMGFLGFGVLAGLLPMSGWMARVTLAPAPLSALMHALAANAGVLAAARLLFDTVSLDTVRGGWVQMVMLAVCIVSAAYGEVRMLRAPDVEMRMAWSSVSNFAFMLLGVSLLTGDGLSGALSHMVSHGVAKMALFFCTGIILERTGRTHARDMHGLGRYLPWTFVSFTVAGLSLMGVPPLPGFVSKYALITAAFSQGGLWQHAGAFVMAISTVFTAADIFLVVFPAFCLPSSLRPGETLKDCGLKGKCALGLLCALLIAASLIAWPLMRDLTLIGGGMPG